MIRAGYGRTPQEIGRRYTYRQIQAFFREELAEERRRRRKNLVDIAAATVGGKPAEKHLQELRDTED